MGDFILNEGKNAINVFILNVGTKAMHVFFF